MIQVVTLYGGRVMHGFTKGVGFTHTTEGLHVLDKDDKTIALFPRDTMPILIKEDKK